MFHVKQSLVHTSGTSEYLSYAQCSANLYLQHQKNIRCWKVIPEFLRGWPIDYSSYRSYMYKDQYCSVSVNDQTTKGDAQVQTR